MSFGVVQSEAICVLSQFFLWSCQERFPWTPSCRSNFFPVELSKFENITSLERILFAKSIWERIVPSRHSRDSCSDFRHSVNLSCFRFGNFVSEAFRKESVCLTRFAWYHRGLLRVFSELALAKFHDIAPHALLITLIMSLSFQRRQFLGTRLELAQRWHQQNL